MTGTLYRTGRGRVGARSTPTAPGDPALRLVGTVLVLAVGTLGFRLGSGADPPTAVATAAAVLVAGCPPAVLLAAGAVAWVAGRRAARLGVRVGPVELDLLGHVDTVVLARTGVVTAGVATVRGVAAAGGVEPAEVLRLAGAVAGRSGHVLAVAVAEAAATAGDVPDVADFDGVPGGGMRGIVGELDGEQVVAHAVLVGSPAFLLDHGVELPAELAEARSRAELAGRTAVAVAWDGVARGVLDVDDPVRPDAAEALAALRRLGVRPVLVTGAAETVGESLAGQLGLGPDEVVAGAGGAAEVVALLRAKGALPACATRDGGGLVDLPAGPAGAAGLVTGFRLARRAQRVLVAVRGLTTAAAIVAAAAAACGLLDPWSAAAAPAVGVLVVATGALVVALCGGPGANRTRRASGVTPVTTPDGATCG